MNPIHTPHPIKQVSVLGVLMRIVLGFTSSIPLVFVVAIVFLGAIFRLFGICGFFEFVTRNLGAYLSSIIISLLSISLFVLLVKKRQVAVPIALLTGIGILFNKKNWQAYPQYLECLPRSISWEKLTFQGKQAWIGDADSCSGIITDHWRCCWNYPVDAAQQALYVTPTIRVCPPPK